MIKLGCFEEVMKMLNTNLWVKNLDSIYQQVITARADKAFFLAIYDYVDYVLTTDTLAQLSNVFFVYKNSDYENAEQLKQDLISNIESVIPPLTAFMTDNQLLKEYIGEIVSIRNGTTQVLGDPEGWISIFNYMERMVNNCFKDGIANTELLNLLKVDEFNANGIIKWHAQAGFNKYQSEMKRIERLRETRAWWAWEHCQLFYEVMKDYEGMRADEVSKGHWFRIGNLGVLKEEMDNVLTDAHTVQKQVFIHDNYIIYLNKVHRQLINEIIQFEVANNAKGLSSEHVKKKGTIEFSFDPETAIIVINGKAIHFRKDTQKMALLKLLVNKPRGIYYDEVAEEIEGAVIRESKNLQNAYYEACRGIQISMLKVEITDFLIFNYNHAKINPLYKRVKE